MTPAAMPHQIVGTDFLTTAGRAVLADEAGLGKTRQAIDAAEGRTLVLAPAMLTGVWEDELALWRPDFQATIVGYSSLCERIENKKGQRVLVQERPWREYAGPWDTVICDEAHYLKGRKTKWTNALAKIRSDRLFMLTGTPMPNWGHEIFMFLRLLYPKDKRFTSYWRWVGNWFELGYNRFSGQQSQVGPMRSWATWEDLARECGLTGHWLRREEDTVSLPPMRHQTIRCPLTVEQERVYKRLKKEAYALIEETGHEIISWSSGGVWTKLLKITTGLGVEDPTLGARHSSKLAALLDVMAERTHPTVIFCTFRSTAELVSTMLAAELGRNSTVIHGGFPMKHRQETARGFAHGKYDVLVGTYGTISEGFTFTRADTSIFIERDPRPTKRHQALKRIHRIGQTKPCLAIDLVAPNTCDSAMLDLLAEKTDDQMAAMQGFEAAQLL